MCSRELVIDSSVHGLEDLTVRVLQKAVREGFVPSNHDDVMDCARIVSTSTAPDAAQYHDQGELFDQVIDYLNSTITDECTDTDAYVVEDNSLYLVCGYDCEDPGVCDL